MFLGEGHRFQQEMGDDIKVYPVSAATGEGLDVVIRAVWSILQPFKEQRIQEAGEETHGIEYVGRTTRPRPESGPLTITREGEVFTAKGEGLERLVQKLDLDNEAAVRHMQSVLLRKGVYEALREAGVKDGDTVRIAGREFEFVEPQD
jgi:GTP-binding protein